MKAAVVTAWRDTPRYEDYPEPASERGAVVEVLAAALHPRVRSQAAGSHYSSTDELPMVPGIDGVGRMPNGELAYFLLGDAALGSMATRTLVDPRRAVTLPPDADPVAIAAAMNPAMSSWVALRRRIALAPGAAVMVLGATGNAGGLAIRVSRLLGAGSVVAVGRGSDDRLAALGADAFVSLDGDPAAYEQALGAAGARVDVVVDYLWGQVTADALAAIIPRRADASQELTWIQIGSMAGLEAPVPSAALRAARLSIVGSGQGSVPTRDIAAEIGELAGAIIRGELTVETTVAPLANVEQWWAPREGSARVVFVP